MSNPGFRDPVAWIAEFRSATMPVLLTTPFQIGTIGRNFAAGMSGGIAYVFDEEGTFESHCNTAHVALEHVDGPLAAIQPVDGGSDNELKNRGKTGICHMEISDEALLKSLVEKHAKYTSSRKAQRILENWQESRALFVKVMPDEYRKALVDLAAKKQLEAA